MSRSDTSVPYPLGVSQAVSFTDSSARTSAGVGEFTRKVALSTDQDCYYVFGDSAVTATTSGTFLRAGGEHFVQIRGGQYVAAIRDTTSGTLHVSEFAY